MGVLPDGLQLRLLERQTVAGQQSQQLVLRTSLELGFVLDAQTHGLDGKYPDTLLMTLAQGVFHASDRLHPVVVEGLDPVDPSELGRTVQTAVHPLVGAEPEEPNLPFLLGLLGPSPHIVREHSDIVHPMNGKEIDAGRLVVGQRSIQIFLHDSQSRRPRLRRQEDSLPDTRMPLEVVAEGPPGEWVELPAVDTVPQSFIHQGSAVRAHDGGSAKTELRYADTRVTERLPWNDRIPASVRTLTVIVHEFPLNQQCVGLEGPRIASARGLAPSHGRRPASAAT